MPRGGGGIDFPPLHFRLAAPRNCTERQISRSRDQSAGSTCRANYGIISWRGLFRNTHAPVKSNNSRDSLSVYSGLMRNFPNNAAFLITVPRLRAYTANNRPFRTLRQFSRRPAGAILRNYRAINPLTHLNLPCIFYGTNIICV